MKLFVIFISAFLGLSSVSLAREAGVRRSRDGKSSSSNGYGAVSENALNLRIFPLNYYSSSLHLGLEVMVSDHFAIGGELSVMPKAQTVGSYFIGKPDYGWYENYGGVLGQYYFTERMGGFFLEGGLNLLGAEIAYDEYTGSGISISRSGSSQFLMPHASLNYRFRMASAGLNSTLGLGFYSLVGDALTYTRRLTVEGASVNSTEESDYRPSTRLRLRFDIGYTF